MFKTLHLNLDLRELARDITYGASYALYRIRCDWYEWRLTRVMRFNGRCFDQLEKRNGAQPANRVVLRCEQKLNLEIIKFSGRARWLRMKLNYVRMNYEFHNKDLTNEQKTQA